MSDEVAIVEPSRWGAEIAAAFVGAQAEMGEVTKDRKAKIEMKQGGAYSYTYADLATVVGVMRPVFAKHGLAYSQDVTRRQNMIEVYTLIVHSSGQSITFGPMGFGAGDSPREAGSAITYARRYALLAALGLATEDDDGASAGRAAPETYADPSPPDPVHELWKRVEAAKDTPVAEVLKGFARDNHRKLTEASLAQDAKWCEQIEEILDTAAGSGPSETT